MLGVEAALSSVNYIINLKTYIMKTILLVKEIYTEGFRNLGNFIAKRFLKFLAWFSFIMFAIVLYAFIYRISTGFAFN